MQDIFEKIKSKIVNRIKRIRNTEEMRWYLNGSLSSETTQVTKKAWKRGAYFGIVFGVLVVVALSSVRYDELESDSLLLIEPLEWIIYSIIAVYYIYLLIDVCKRGGAKGIYYYLYMAKFYMVLFIFSAYNMYLFIRAYGHGVEAILLMLAIFTFVVLLWVGNFYKVIVYPRRKTSNESTSSILNTLRDISHSPAAMLGFNVVVGVPLIYLLNLDEFLSDNAITTLVFIGMLYSMLGVDGFYRYLILIIRPEMMSDDVRKLSGFPPIKKNRELINATNDTKNTEVDKQD